MIAKFHADQPDLWKECIGELERPIRLLNHICPLRFAPVEMTNHENYFANITLAKRDQSNAQGLRFWFPGGAD